MSDTRDTLALLARDAYGRLLAYLARKTRDLAGAEDALADAFRAALETWPTAGLPDRPEAWLLTAANRKLIDDARRRTTRTAAEETLRATLSAAAGILSPPDMPAIPDERLALLFTCAHPALDPAVRTPLMLQTVLGFEAADIASLFLTSPAAMAQRLVRAKTKIRDAGIRFEVPGRDELPARLGHVLESIYAAYTAGFEHTASPEGRGFTVEALHLCGVLTRLLPDQPEALGLHALLLYTHARHAARLSPPPDAAFVPLDQQDTTLWNAADIARAEELLREAATFQSPGRFQLEALIQSVHTDRARTGETRWDIIASTYNLLLQIAPTLGTEVARAAALSHTDAGPAAALALLDALPPAAVAAYQPYWAVRAHVLGRLARPAEASDAYTRAIGLTSDPAVRAFLAGRMHAARDG